MTSQYNNQSKQLDPVIIRLNHHGVFLRKFCMVLGLKHKLLSYCKWYISSNKVKWKYISWTIFRLSADLILLCKLSFPDVNAAHISFTLLLLCSLRRSQYSVTVYSLSIYLFMSLSQYSSSTYLAIRIVTELAMLHSSPYEPSFPTSVTVITNKQYNDNTNNEYTLELVSTN